MARYRQGWSSGWRKSASPGRREWYDSSWELQYMDELDRDALVARWTRHHGLRIPYRKWWGASGSYEPDFLVELVGGGKELREVKGEHLFSDANTVRKLRAGDEYCRRRAMKYRVITKSQIDPEAWAPAASTEELSTRARPSLAEDAFQPQRPVNPWRAVAIVASVIALAGIVALALCR